MKKRPTLFIAWLLLCASVPPLAADPRTDFVFNAWGGPPVRVFLAEPEALSPDTPVVFVMHGVRRNADEYRDQWLSLALENQFLLVVPEFNQQDFPGSAFYNLGGVFDRSGQQRPREKWAYSLIEPLFDALRQRYSLTRNRYALYGHSAGSQFVHRFAFHVPEARAYRIVTANAGWYMMPDRHIEYPYGLHDSAVSTVMAERALALPLLVLLGEEDNDPQHEFLRRAPEAMAQGQHRLERGQTFYTRGKAAAESLGLEFNWALETVPGAAHDNRQMAPAALPWLLP